MRRKFILIVTFILLFTSVAYGQIGIENDVRSYIIVDYQEDEILEEYNIDEIVEIASISKIMTYLLTRDELESGRFSMEDPILIGPEIEKIGGSSLKVKAGEVYSLESLLEGLMIVSANDAAHAIGQHIGGTEEKFVKMMNDKAKELGLESAVFFNPSGLPIREINDQNKMTTRDLYKLSKYIIDKYPDVLDITKKPFIEDKSRDFIGKNTNPILNYIEGVDGFKTGYTDKAGYCNVSTFVEYGLRDISVNNRYLTIIMGTKNLEERDRVSRLMADHVVENYSNKIILNKDVSIAKIDNIKARDGEIVLYPRESFNKLIDLRDEKNIDVRLNKKIKFPIRGDKTIGQVVVQLNGEDVFQTDLVTKDKVKGAGFFRLVYRKIRGLFN